jgi:hypothetical protein
MPEEITRREILIGATTMAAAAALPQFSVEPLAATCAGAIQRPAWLEKLLWRAVINQPYGEDIETTLARYLGRPPTEDDIDFAAWAAAWVD